MGVLTYTYKRKPLFLVNSIVLSSSLIMNAVSTAPAAGARFLQLRLRHSILFYSFSNTESLLSETEIMGLRKFDLFSIF